MRQMRIIEDLRSNLFFIQPERMESLAKERSGLESFAYLLVCLLAPYVPVLLLSAIFNSLSEAWGQMVLIAIMLPFALTFIAMSGAVSFGILRLLGGKGGFMETLRIHIYGGTLSHVLSLPILLALLLGFYSAFDYLGTSGIFSMALSGTCISLPLLIVCISLINVVQGVSRVHRVPALIALIAVIPFPILTVGFLTILGTVLFLLFILVAIFMAMGSRGPGMY